MRCELDSLSPERFRELTLNGSGQIEERTNQTFADALELGTVRWRVADICSDVCEQIDHWLAFELSAFIASEVMDVTSLLVEEPGSEASYAFSYLIFSGNTVDFAVTAKVIC